MMKATKTEKSDWMDRYIVRCLLQGVVLAILLLGGLYLYMNRYEYLHVDNGSGGHMYYRINKLTGYGCTVWGGLQHSAKVRQKPYSPVNSHF
jgi:hypothetical protein